MANPSSQPDRQGCVIIPAYNEARHIGEVVRQVRNFVENVAVIDDGSRDDTAAVAAAAGATVIRHPTNLGKGAALQTGFQYAREKNFDYVITMDADGQHDPADIPAFLEAYRRIGIPVLVGNRMSKPAGMPWLRKLTNRFMSWLLSREMRRHIADTQCGFRLYRCKELPFGATESTRYAAESEILLQLAARGIRMDSVPIAVIYRDEKSKINPWRDTLRFIAMLYRYRRRRRLQRNA